MTMTRTGFTDLPLHGGNAPRWLFTRMVSLAEAISEVIIEEMGTEELIRRLSDPFWFQAFSCVLGFDWHSSGTTTVTCGALKVALQDSQQICVAGGKGSTSKGAPGEIARWVEKQGIHTKRGAGLIRASKLAAKVDSAAVQDGHQLYHHCFVFDRIGNWSVVQQGMNGATGYARRYQWFSGQLDSFIDEPHQAITGTRVTSALDMTAKASTDCRRACVDLVSDGVERLQREVVVVEAGQSTIEDWCGGGLRKLHMPRDIDWKTLRRAYEVQPSGYEEMLSIPGIGPSTVRALALMAELVYGSGPSWRDPVKFSFTVGGKDGVPYPVDRRAMDHSTQILKAGIDAARLGEMEKLQAIERLRRFVPPDFSF
jgi:hypothetical protein